MKKCLIDTDIWIDILRGKNLHIQERADSYWQVHGTFTLSAITIAEVVRGLLRIQQPEVLSKWRGVQQYLEVVPVDKAVAELAGEIICTTGHGWYADWANGPTDCSDSYLS